MGLDGGTIVTRSDVLRGQSWRVAQNDTSRSTRGGNVSRVSTEAADKALGRSIAWSTCALSSEPLQAPIVSCGLGRLYNKDAVLQFLLAKKGKVSSSDALLGYANQLRVAAGGLDHINSLKDVMEVHLHAAGDDGPSNPASTSNPSNSVLTTSTAAAAAAAAGRAGAGGPTATGGAAVASASMFVCPITLLPCDRHPCSALRPCGHVLSDRALANIRGPGQGSDTSCPICGASFTSTLPINGSLEQVQSLRDQIRAAAAAAAAAKASKPSGSKKRKAPEAAEADGSGSRDM